MDNLKDLEAMHTVLAEFRKISQKNREVLLGILNREHEAIGSKLDEPFADIKRRWIEGGRRDKITAIKEVRTASGINSITGYANMGLKESKELVESW